MYEFDHLQIHPNFKIDDVLNSAEFDALLVDIERSLEIEASDKVEGDSELAEVLKYLEESSKQRRLPKDATKNESIQSSMMENEATPPMKPDSTSFDKKSEELPLPPAVTHSPEPSKIAERKQKSSTEKATRQLDSAYDTSKRLSRAIIVDNDGESSNSEGEDDWQLRRKQIKSSVMEGNETGHVEAWKGISSDFVARGFRDLVPDTFLDIQAEVETESTGKHDEPDYSDVDTFVDNETGVNLSNDENSSVEEFDSAISSNSDNGRIDSSPVTVDNNAEVVSLKATPGRNESPASQESSLEVSIDQIVLGMESESNGVSIGARGGILTSCDTAPEEVTNTDESTNSAGLFTKRQRRSRKDTRFVNSIAVAKNRTEAPLISVVSPDAVHLESSVSPPVLSSSTISPPCDSLKEEKSQKLDASTTPVPDLSRTLPMASCFPPIVTSLVERYLCDPGISSVDALAWKSFPLLRIACSDCICHGSDAGIGSLMSWFFSFALHSKVKIVGIGITNENNLLVGGEQCGKEAQKYLNILIYKEEGETVDGMSDWMEHFCQVAHRLTLGGVVERDRGSVHGAAPPDFATMFSVPDSTLLSNICSILSFKRDEALYMNVLLSVLNYRLNIVEAEARIQSTTFVDEVPDDFYGHLVTCILKPYLTRDNAGISTFNRFMRACEENGFRLVALRSAFVSESWLLSHKEIIRILPSWFQGAVHTKSGQNSDFFGLATVKPSNEPMATLLTISFYHSCSFAARKMQELLGPEDPTLARRTDPNSIRALLGDTEDRNRNVAYPVSGVPERSNQETKFWVGSTPNRQSGFRMSVPRKKKLYVAFEVFFPGNINSGKYLKKVLSAVQNGLLRCLSVFSVMGAKYDSLTSLDEKSFQACKAVMKDVYSSCTGDCGNVSPSNKISLYWLAEFCTVIGEVAVASALLSIKCAISSLCDRLRPVSPEVKLWVGEDIDMVFRADSDRRLLLPSEIESIVSLIGDDKSSYMSHENLLLGDCIVVLFSQTHCSVQDLLKEIFSNLSSLCSEFFIVGSKVASGRTEESSVCFSGIHILENITDAVTSAVDLVLDELDIDCKKKETMRSEVLMAVRVLKGKRALEFIANSYSAEELLIDGILLDLKTFVPEPLWGTISEQFMTFRSLFVPGTFDAVSVILMPPIMFGKFAERALSRLLKCLEKEGVDLLMMQHVELDSGMTWKNVLLEEAANEYEWDESTVLRAQASLNDYAIALLVRGNGCVRRIQRIIGPCFVDSTDEHPRSVQSLLVSLGVKSAPIFVSLSCQTAEVLARAIFGVSQEIALNMPALGIVENSSTGVLTGSGLSQLVMQSCNNFPEQHEGRVILHDELGGISSLTSALPKSFDVSCVIITSTLLEEAGASAIFESLSREGLKVCNSVNLLFI